MVEPGVHPEVWLDLPIKGSSRMSLVEEVGRRAGHWPKYLGLWHGVPSPPARGPEGAGSLEEQCSGLLPLPALERPEGRLRPHQVPSQRSGLSALISSEGRLGRQSFELRQEARPRFGPEKWAHVATLDLPSSLTGGVRGGSD